MASEHVVFGGWWLDELVAVGGMWWPVRLLCMVDGGWMLWLQIFEGGG